MKLSKPTVQYTGNPRFEVWEPHGTVAHIYAFAHPKLGSGPVRTSLVKKVNDDGSFETMNTIYIPVKETSEDTTD